MRFYGSSFFVVAFKGLTYLRERERERVSMSRGRSRLPTASHIFIGFWLWAWFPLWIHAPLPKVLPCHWSAPHSFASQTSLSRRIWRSQSKKLDMWPHSKSLSLLQMHWIYQFTGRKDGFICKASPPNTPDWGQSQGLADTKVLFFITQSYLWSCQESIPTFCLDKMEVSKESFPWQNVSLGSNSPTMKIWEAVGSLLLPLLMLTLSLSLSLK